MKVKFLALLVVATSLAAAQTQAPPAASPAQPAKPETATIASVLDRTFSGVERVFVGAAEAMPEDKYTFAPTNGEFKGVSNFAEQVKHVAATNYLVFSAVLGETPPAGSADERGPATLKTKADILKYLRDSFALGHRAIAVTSDQNVVAPLKNPFGGANTVTRLGLTTLIVGHCFDHYGQMVEYLRMNGIVPPASRRQ
jgi:uncharacterized damage-inducible protein DinB